MLYVRSLTTPEQRELRRLRREGQTTLALRAHLVLLSAAGWSVPAIADSLGCCRRTVRTWIHRFTRTGLAALVPRVVQRVPAAISAKPAAGPAPVRPSRLVPVVRLSVPEIRRLLNGIVFVPFQSREHTLHWSLWRRYKQALAMRSHYRKRGAAPPTFKQVRLEY
jgi:hypothetical protein